MSIIAGCQWGDQIESLVQPNPDDFMVLFADTSTVEISTVRFDSIMTGGSDRMTVGRYVDPYFGPVHATIFMQPTYQGFTLPETAEFDSLVLSLKYYSNSQTGAKSYSYGDTTKLVNLSVHALTVDMLVQRSIDNPLKAYFNHNMTPYDSVPMAVKSFYPRPYEGKSLTFRLPDTFGKKIFDLSKANQLTTNDEWIALLKGLMIRAKSTDNGAIIGFNKGHDSTAIQLHYHVTGNDGLTKDYVSFTNTAAYNQVLSDLTNTDLKALPTTRRLSLPSEKSGNKSFIQEGTGIMTRIDLPHIQSLRDVKYSVSNRALLRITPIRQSVTRYLPAPPQLHVFLCDKNNQLIAPLTDLQNQPVVGNYKNDLINNTEYYEFDLSSYVTNILNNPSSSYNGLMLLTSGLGGTSAAFPEAGTEWSMGNRRLVIGNQKDPREKGVKLELYYTTVKAGTK